MKNVRPFVVMLVSMLFLLTPVAPVAGIGLEDDLEDPVTLQTSTSDGIFHEVSLAEDNYTVGDAPENFTITIASNHVPPAPEEAGGLQDARFDRVTFPFPDDFTWNAAEDLSVTVGTQEYAYSEVSAEDCVADPAALPGFVSSDEFTWCVDEERELLHVTLGNITRSPLDTVTVQMAAEGLPETPDNYTFDVELFTSLSGIDHQAGLTGVQANFSTVGEPVYGPHELGFEVLEPLAPPVEIGVSVEADPPTIPAGGSTDLMAAATQDGEPWPEAAFTWDLTPEKCGSLVPDEADSALAILNAGSEALSCTVTATETTSGTTGSAIVNIAGALDVIVMEHAATADDLEASADDGITVVATALDSDGNPVPGIDLYWSFLKNDEGGAFSAGSSETDADGEATVTLLIDPTAGNEYQVRAQDDDVDPTRGRNSGTWVVVAGALDTGTSTLDIPGDAVAGESFSATLTLRDQHGNLLASGEEEKNGDFDVNFEGPGPGPDETQPVCGGEQIGGPTTLTFTDALAEFDCTLYRAETVTLQVLNVDEPAAAALFGTEIEVLAAPATEAAWISGATSINAGDCEEYGIRIIDNYGNPQGNGEHIVDFGGAGDGAFYEDAACADDTSAITIADGTAGASVYYTNTLNEDVSLSADATGLTNELLAVEVNPAAAHEFIVTLNNDPLTAGASFTLDIEALDEYGNRLDRGEHHYDGGQGLTFSGPGAAPDGSLPVCGGEELSDGATVTFDDGLATDVTCTLYKAETVDLEVDDAALAIGGAVEVVVGAAAFDVFTIMPVFEEHTWVGPGETQDVIATAFDLFENPKPDVQFYAWAEKFAGQNGATVSPTQGQTAADGTFTTTLTVSNEGGDKFRVKISDTPDPATSYLYSGIFEVADAVVEEGGSIQTAVNDAEEGDVILVEEGVYEERIVISSVGVHLVAENDNVDLIVSDQMFGSNTLDALRIVADGVTIEGFNVVRIIDDAGISNSGLTPGIQIRSSDVSLIRGSATIIDSAGDDADNLAVWLHSLSTEPMSNIKIEGMIIEGDINALWMVSLNEVSDVEFVGNTITTIDGYGLRVSTHGGGSPPSNVNIFSNSFTYDADSGPYVRDDANTLDLNPVVDDNVFDVAVKIHETNNWIVKDE